MYSRHPRPTLSPYTTLFRSEAIEILHGNLFAFGQARNDFNRVQSDEPEFNPLQFRNSIADHKDIPTDQRPSRNQQRAVALSENNARFSGNSGNHQLLRHIEIEPNLVARGIGIR